MDTCIILVVAVIFKYKLILILTSEYLGVFVQHLLANTPSLYMNTCILLIVAVIFRYMLILILPSDYLGVSTWVF